MEKNTITKWLLEKGEFDGIIITENEISKFAPINRVLDIVGYFKFKFINVKESKYLIVYEGNEEYSYKSKLLISKIHPFEEKVIDISNEDYDNVVEIAKEYMNVIMLVN